MSNKEAQLNFLLLQGGLHGPQNKIPNLRKGSSSQALKGQWGRLISKKRTNRYVGFEVIYILFFHIFPNSPSAMDIS